MGTNSPFALLNYLLLINSLISVAGKTKKTNAGSCSHQVDQQQRRRGRKGKKKEKRKRGKKGKRRK